MGFFFVCGIGSTTTFAQGDISGSENLLYTNQFKDGMYTSANYENQDISYNNFYEYLAPFGQWINDAQYGYVWSPEVPATFRPYFTNGHWALTSYGNTWVSEYQWGWACFHYGRWIFDSYYGWLWVPGTNWGPAWVSWRSGGGNIGWAPLAAGYEYSSSELKKYNCPKDWWVFIPQQYIYSDNYYRYYTGPLGNAHIFKSTEFINNVYVSNGITYFPGPTQLQMEKIIGKPVKVNRLLNAGSPRAAFVHNDLIKLYRPAEIKPTPANGEKVSPPDYVTSSRHLINVMDPVNVNSGNPPAFRNDLPAMSHTTLHPVTPVNPTNTGRGNYIDEHRADKTEYKTDIITTDPQKRGSNTLSRKHLGALPPQGTQSPEPVKLPEREEPKPLKVEQHADPTPAMPAPNPNNPIPTPKQNPEPMPPSGK